MGKHAIRKDMTCLNCGHVVEKRFCPNCGQENIETKQSFYYLFFHTIEDIVHYDSAFWKTIRYLLLHPAKLTLEYLSGKRKRYVAPVKLYIFISFLTFFLLSVLTSLDPNKTKPITTIGENLEQQQNKAIQIDSLSFDDAFSEQKSPGEQWLLDRLKNVTKESQNKDFHAKFYKSLYNNIPKALFLFLPIFTFVLWLFHDKKNWYYFDNGIFTIHYFSMLLLSYTINASFIFLLSWLLAPEIVSIIENYSTPLLFLWWVLYFYKAHSRFYKEKFWYSLFKASFIGFINLFLFSILILFLIAYSALNVN